MKKIFLKGARYLIPFMPKGKSWAIKIATSLLGYKFGDIITVKDGRKFYIDDISLVKRHLFFLNEYEDYETRVISRIVKKGDYVVDVGASFGWFTTLMSKLVGESGKVFAFELAPNIAEECRKNINLNDMADNVVLEDVALGDEEKDVNFIYSKDLGLGNMNPHGLDGAGKTSANLGKMTTLDMYIKKNSIQKIDFIKCDIDGAEVIFLKGAKETISSFKPVIIIEASGAHGRPSCFEIFNILSQFDYKFFSLHHKIKLKPIEYDDFKNNFKENILCLPNHKLELLNGLK